MVVGLPGNESSDSNRFTLVTPKPANGVRLQATLGNQNPTGLPVGAVSLQNVFFGFLSFIPFVAAIGGFEYAYQKKASSATEKTKNFRRKSAAKRYATDIFATTS